MSAATNVLKEEETMTDKQFDSIIEMVIQILNRSKDLDDAQKALIAIKRGCDEPQETKKPNCEGEPLK